MLVHCYAGQSRSVALMLAYLCSALHMRLADAFQLVLHARPSACPNSGRTPLQPCLPDKRADFLELDFLQHELLTTGCTSSRHTQPQAVMVVSAGFMRQLEAFVDTFQAASKGSSDEEL